MMKSTTTIQSEKPLRLMRRLCKHWRHKFPVSFDDEKGQIELPFGVCNMRSTDALTVELTSDAEQMPKFQQVVADHLHRMAMKDETLVIEWQQAA